MRHAVVLLALVGCDDVFHLDIIPPSGCPMNYTQLSTGRYRVIRTGQPWGTAEAMCAADEVNAVGKHTHLAVTGSAESATNEVDTLYAFTKPTKVWVGLTDRVTPPPACPVADPARFYQWITAEPIAVPASHMAPWFSGDPLLPCTQQCVALHDTSANLDDQNCADNYGAICECDDYPAVMSRF